MVSDKHTSLLQYRINYNRKKITTQAPTSVSNQKKGFKFFFQKLRNLDFIFIFEIVQRLRIPNRVFQFLNFFVQLGFVLNGATFD